MHAGELGVPKALVTNAPRSNISVLLTALDLAQFFPPERQVFGDECARGKPHPDPYLRGLELFSVHPRDALALEDSAVGGFGSIYPLPFGLIAIMMTCPLSGLQSSLSAGIPSVGVSSTITPQRLFDLGAALSISDYNCASLRSLFEARSTSTH